MITGAVDAWVVDYQEIIELIKVSGVDSLPPLYEMTLNDIPADLLPVSECSKCALVAVVDKKAPPTVCRMVIVKAPLSEDGVVVNTRRFHLDLSIK